MGLQRDMRVSPGQLPHTQLQICDVVARTSGKGRRPGGVHTLQMGLGVPRLCVGFLIAVLAVDTVAGRGQRGRGDYRRLELQVRVCLK